ncbi:hypothetical protein FV218_15120 [Methylobacterium sp. WL69]|nr:hypothetical protein FV218_15120 [Methylobacterium sp. WL69]
MEPETRRRPLAGAHALGGPVRSGLPYLVGERGPEIFVPGATGRIETNGALRNLSASRRSPMAALVSPSPVTPRTCLTRRFLGIFSWFGSGLEDYRPDARRCRR